MVGVPVIDGSGDEVMGWQDSGQKAWMQKRDRQSMREISAAHEVLRDADTVFIVRASDRSRSWTPEDHRFWYKERLYEIVGFSDATVDREDCIAFLCAYRPDGRGARGPSNGSQP